MVWICLLFWFCVLCWEHSFTEITLFRDLNPQDYQPKPKSNQTLCRTVIPDDQASALFSHYKNSQWKSWLVWDSCIEYKGTTGWPDLNWEENVWDWTYVNCKTQSKQHWKSKFEKWILSHKPTISQFESMEVVLVINRKVQCCLFLRSTEAQHK